MSFNREEELLNIIQEKNRIIDELKFIIAQKDSMIDQNLRFNQPVTQQNNSSVNQNRPPEISIPRNNDIVDQSPQHENDPRLQGDIDPIQQNIAEPRLQDSPGPQTPLGVSTANTGDTTPTPLRRILEVPDIDIDTDEYFRYIRETERPQDTKDGVIKDLLTIIVEQLDFKQATARHPIVKKLLMPYDGNYKFVDGTYYGQLVLGIPNGEGKTEMDGGDSYTGQYLHGKKNGRGIYRFFNGDVYDGDHQEGHEHGKGMYRYADGDVYIGDYRNGKRHGFGVLKLKSGTTEYGRFSHGNYDGKFIMISADENQVSLGDFAENKQEGIWKYYNFLEQKVYVGGSKVA